MRRIQRNFWILATASVLAVGLLSTAIQLPPSAFAGTLTAVSGVAAAASLALAGRILVVMSRARAHARPPRRAGLARRPRGRALP